MKRVVHKALMFFSLLISVAIAYFWIRSGKYVDNAVYYFPVANPQRIWYGNIHSISGIVELRAGVEPDLLQSQVWTVHSWLFHMDGLGPQTIEDYLEILRRITLVGFRVQLTFEDYFVAVPYWFLMLLTLALPIYKLARRRKLRRRRMSGVCLQCGYDLRASPGRCPECGKISDHIQPA